MIAEAKTAAAGSVALIALALATFAFAIFSKHSLISVMPPKAEAAGPTVIFLTSGTSWTVPADWVSYNTIEVIAGAGGGGGGDPGSPFDGGGGGGGGGYTKATNVVLTPGSTVNYSIGAGGAGGGLNADGSDGGDTYVCNSTLNCGSLAGTAVVAGAQHGSKGTSNSGAGGAGGAAASGVPAGAQRQSGGAGGSRTSGSTTEGGFGGGGAGGPNGNGGAGGNGPCSRACGGSTGGGGANGGSAGGNEINSWPNYDASNGGNNRLGTGGGIGGAGAADGNVGGNGSSGGGGGGAGGSSAQPNGGKQGGNGSQDAIWTQTSNGAKAGPGSGAGGGGVGFPSGGTGGVAGLYGGGGAGAGASNNGASGSGSAGAPGIIVITYPVYTTPSAPTSLAAASSGSSINLTWTTPASNGGTAITNYKIYRTTASPASTLLTTIGNITNYTDNTAITGTTYYYRVIATNSVGDSSYSNESSAAVTLAAPSAPQSLSASGGIAQISLTWTAPASNGGSPITNYKIYRSTSPTPTTLYQTVGNVLSYSDTSVTVGTTYYYRVKATNAVGDSVYSNEANAVAAASCPAGNNGGNVTGWAWSDTIGWISLNSGDSGTCAGTHTYGLTTSGNTITGYAWSENIGWIQFGGLAGFPSGAGTSAVNAQTSGSSVIGWARALAYSDPQAGGWDGWISLSGTGYGLTNVNGTLTGYAWGDMNIGWIDFSANYACGQTYGYYCSGNVRHYKDLSCNIDTIAGVPQTCSYLCTNGACVPPPNPQGTLNSNGTAIKITPNLVRPKGTATVSWSTSNTTSCTVTENNPAINDSWTGTSGTQTTSPISSATTYTLNCQGYGGLTLTQTATVKNAASFREF